MKATIYVLALSLAGVLTGTAAPTLAAPVLTNTAAVKAAVPDHVTEVRWRGGYGGWGYRGGLLLMHMGSLLAKPQPVAPVPQYFRRLFCILRYPAFGSGGSQWCRSLAFNADGQECPLRPVLTRCVNYCGASSVSRRVSPR